MPVYRYHCDCGAVVERLLPSCVRDMQMCAECGGPLQRELSTFTVCWGGLAPSRGELEPQLKQFIDDAPRRREANAAKYGRSPDV
jgi:hypothetical protein